MTDRCMTCQHWSAKGAQAMATLGFARCTFEPAWKFRPPSWGCTRHRQVDEAAAGRRQAFLRAKGVVA